MTFLKEMDKSGLVDAEAARNKGRDLAEVYNDAEPYPHIVIEDFLPRPVIDLCLREFVVEGQEGHVSYNRSQERLKREYKPDLMSIGPRNLFYSFNSRPFISLLENITGIKGLIPDPYYLGAGFHEIQNGDHLSVHADFNHHKPLGLERRINVLIYLNESWEIRYGGQLELWDESMSTCLKSIVPVMNRCVIFNTTSKSNHGNPHPVNHPKGQTRKSIALYYYTSTWNVDMREHSTQFRVRPKTDDKFDWRIKAQEFALDIAPPLFLRTARSVVRKLRGSTVT